MVIKSTINGFCGKRKFIIDPTIKENDMSGTPESVIKLLHQERLKYQHKWSITKTKFLNDGNQNFFEINSKYSWKKQGVGVAD